MKIKRALISVSDKTFIIPLAFLLQKNGVEIISTGGTKKHLQKAGINVVDISSVTGNPEAFGGRMKTLSFEVESALLFDRERDKDEAEELGIKPIDLVVCNLYPFEEVAKKGADFDDLIENIDIGGPTMIRSAAKNFKYVTVLTSPDDYPSFMEEFKNNQGSVSYEFRKKMMVKAFNHTADYDSVIAQSMDQETGTLSKRLHFTDGKNLRYGENGHQQAVFYRLKDAGHSLHAMEILHGKPLSYNNILDVTGALYSVREMQSPACAVVKHSNPCGLAEGENLREVLEKAWLGDPVSAFGSVIAFNRKVDKSTVEFFRLDAEDKSKRKFIEVIVAPGYEQDALAYLKQHKNLRILVYNPGDLPVSPDYRFVPGGLLEQTPDDKLYEKLETVSGDFSQISQELIDFGLKAVKNIKSNAIAIVGEKKGYRYLMGMGAGQPNRLVATKLAIEKAREFLKMEWENHKNKDWNTFYNREISRALLISDAFFPFPDNVELAAGNGIKYIVQPGGSIRDKQVIESAKELNINMLFTGIRHFKH